MNKKEALKIFRDDLVELQNITPYDLLDFNSKEAELDYIEKKTNEFDICDTFLNKEDSDGIVVVSKNKFYAISPIFIHSDAFIKFFKFLENKGLPHRYDSQDMFEHFNDEGYVLFRVVNNSGVMGFDPYIPDELNDYQIRVLNNFTRDLHKVNHEIEDIDRMNSLNIKYAMKTIKNAVSKNEKKLVK